MIDDIQWPEGVRIANVLHDGNPYIVSLFIDGHKAIYVFNQGKLYLQLADGSDTYVERDISEDHTHEGIDNIIRTILIPHLRAKMSVKPKSPEHQLIEGFLTAMSKIGIDLVNTSSPYPNDWGEIPDEHIETFIQDWLKDRER